MAFSLVNIRKQLYFFGSLNKMTNDIIQTKKAVEILAAFLC